MSDRWTEEQETAFLACPGDDACRWYRYEFNQGVDTVLGPGVVKSDPVMDDEWTVMLLDGDARLVLLPGSMMRPRKS